jgi:hypothetical protein
VKVNKFQGDDGSMRQIQLAINVHVDPGVTKGDLFIG